MEQRNLLLSLSVLTFWALDELVKSWVFVKDGMVNWIVVVSWALTKMGYSTFGSKNY